MTPDELAGLLRAATREQSGDLPWMLTSQYKQWKRWRKQQELPSTLRISRPRVRKNYPRVYTNEYRVAQRERLRASYEKAAAGLTEEQRLAREEHRRLLEQRGVPKRGRPQKRWYDD